jgi:hypothetical protein
VSGSAQAKEADIATTRKLKLLIMGGWIGSKTCGKSKPEGAIYFGVFRKAASIP